MSLRANFSSPTPRKRLLGALLKALRSGRRGRAAALRRPSECACEDRTPDERQERLKRFYAALAQVNQIIVRCSSREELLQETCRVLVEFGGFKLAWVGWLDPDRRAVQPVAQHADGGDPEVCVRSFAQGGPDGHGPLDTAIQESRPAVCNDLLTDPDARPWRDAARQHGIRSAIALPIRVQDETTGVLAVCAVEPGIFGEQETALLAGAVSDLSFALNHLATDAARRQSEAALRASEQLYHSLFDNLLNGFAYCRMLSVPGQPTDFVYLSVNPAFESLTGLKHVVGRKVSEVIPGIQRTDPLLFELYGRVAATGMPDRVEMFVEALQTWFSISVYCPAQDHFVAVFDNITARKLHERELERVSRLYATRNGINQAVVHAQAREELLQDVCRIIAEHAGFKLVWVGWLDRATCAVIPVGRAGDHSGYLDAVTIYADDRPEGRGPIGTCVRSGAASIFNDFLHDPRAQPWHAAAAAHGLRAVAALPIRIRGAVEGVFAVYAGEPNVFKDKEVALLEEVAVDIAFGLENLDNEAERASAQQALRASEEQFRAMFEVASIGMAQADPSTGRWLRVNQRLCAITGYTEREMLGLHVGDITHPDDRDLDRNLFLSVVRGQTPEYRMEKRYRRKDGTLTWVNVNMTVIRDAVGQPVRTLATIEDISERKRMERERDVTLRLLSLLNAPNDLHELLREVTRLLREWSGCDAVGIRLREGDDFPYFETRGFPAAFVEAERSLCLRDATGAPARDADGNPALECMCGNVLCGRFNPAKPFFTTRGSFWSNNTTALLASTTEADRQARTRNRCNGEGYESVALVALRSGQTVYGLLQLNDKRPDCFTPEGIALLERLTDSLAIGLAHRQAALQALQEQARYRQLFDSVNDAIFVYPLSTDHRPGLFVEVNEVACLRLGYTREELLRLSPHDLALSVSPEEVRARAEAILKHGAAVFAVTHVAKDGRKIPVEISARIIDLGGQKLIMAVARDLSERQRADREKQALEGQLRQSQKLEAVGRLAGGVAHDFNNLLCVINGYAHLVLDDLDPSHPQRRDMEEILKAGQRAAELTQQLLAFSRKQVIQPRVLDLNALVRGIQRMAGRIVGEDIEIRTQLAVNLDRVKADPGQIEQAILNLIVNSRDAMPQGGRLVLETRNELLDESHARRHPGATPGPHVLLAVSDTGSGMNQEVQDRIFEPFFTTKAPGKGSGLGLSSVFGIVTQSGGHIVVRSAPGKGTTFSLYLPRANAPNSELEVAETDVPRNDHETILLVEDEETVRNLTALMLSSAGYRVLTATNGAEALALLGRRANPIHLLLTDVVMPSMSGSQLAEQAHQTAPGIKVLFMTGYTDETIARHGLPDADIHLILKPFERLALLRKLREVLDAGSQPGQTGRQAMDFPGATPPPASPV